MKISVFYDHIVEAAEQTDKSIQDILKIVRNAGVTGLEINLTCLMENEKDITKWMQDAQMEISCIYEFYDWGNTEDISKGKMQVDMAAKMGAGKVLVVPGFVTEDEAKEMHKSGVTFLNQNPHVQQMKHALAEIVRYAQTKDIKVTLEDFDLNIAPYATADGLLWFMQQVPGLRFTMDTGNFAYSDEDAWAGFEKLRGYVAHVHCKDRGEEGLSFTYNKGLASCPVGAGYMPIEKVIKALKQDGYDDYLAIEHFGAKDQLQFMEQSAQYLMKQIS